MTLTYDRDVAGIDGSITVPLPGENLFTGKAICRSAPIPSGTLDPSATVGTVIARDFPRYSHAVRGTLRNELRDPSRVVLNIAEIVSRNELLFFNASLPLSFLFREWLAGASVARLGTPDRVSF